ncbi:BT_2262 family domain-containing protein [Anaerophaga thermohalophila]|uniref:BT_2262 family domain-containing protein n=1 Tax=Anaerophaga thermohalophila TaxID=177400 RepID=UPI000237D1FE|nr:BT_2262 family domain-containing protein [Anaerophaga thermohalophila]
MNNIKYLLFLVGIIMLLSSCEKSTSTEDISTITHFVTFELQEGDVVAIEKGEEYVEPGFIAMEGDNDVTSNVTVTGEVGENLGVYELTYSAVNKDGYPSSVTRQVIVYDPASPQDDLTGDYAAEVVRTEGDGTNPRPFPNSSVSISRVAQGIFYVEGLMGNYYSIGSDYGSNYRMDGYIALNSDYSISVLYSHVIGWGDGLEDFRNGSYDPETGTLYWESIYAGGDIFAVTAY